MATVKFNKDEARRLVGLEMVVAGRKTAEIAAACGVTRQVVADWKRKLAAAEGDVERAALDAPRPGRPMRLSVEQIEEVRAMLEAGARAAGFEDDLWTLARVRRAVAERCGVDYSPASVGRLLHQLGYSPQQPVLRARQRDPAAIEKFRRETWPQAVKKGFAGCCHTSCRRMRIRHDAAAQADLGEARRNARGAASR